MKKLSLSMALLVSFVAITLPSLSQTTRANRPHSLGFSSSQVGSGLMYRWIFSPDFAGELQYLVSQSDEADNKLGLATAIIAGKYYPFTSSDFFVSLNYLSLDWKLDVKDAYEGTDVKYEAKRTWDSTLGLGLGADFIGSRKSFFAGTLGFLLAAPSASALEFTEDGGGTDEQKKAAEEKYDGRYANYDSLYLVHLSVAYLF